MNESAHGINTTVAQRFVGEIERCHDELATLRGEYMNRCGSVRERIGNWRDQASEAGIPRMALKTILKERDLERKIRALTQDLDIDERSQLESLRDALGDYGELPLGAAAYAAAGQTPPNAAAPVKRKPGRPRKTAEVVALHPSTSGAEALDSLVSGDDVQKTPEGEEPDLRPEFLRRAGEEQAIANAALLVGGIKPLN